jgi:hypothetical protein
MHAADAFFNHDTLRHSGFKDNFRCTAAPSALQWSFNANAM